MESADAEAELDTGELSSDALLANRYRVESLLGEGGAASVYRVRDAQRGGRVALKRLHLRGTAHDALLTSQFEREYHTLSELAHPSIIEVYDYGVERGRPYYTMELLDGEDLRERGKLAYREVCALLCDVASSLAVVHSRGRVHRDVSARNVRCTREGRAKLLDFGAMVSSGAAHALVGTPPFVPPEAVALQALDGRVDLYALGALCYFMLTGRHAYAAQSFGQLRDLWRSAPPTPRQYEPSVPEALDRLVMELLQLERVARPRTAGEVMERLSGIAGLPQRELPEVQRAYLSLPTLVGREPELQQVRGCLVNALQGRGSAVLIEGAFGVGRSRMLDACVLEAKLLGAVVLRADAADGSHADAYGLVRRLCSDLATALPVVSEQSARPRRDLLSHVLPRQVAPVPPGAAAAVPARRQLQAALRDFFLAVAREHLIVIAVDGLAAADEASAALLGMLAHGATRRRLCILVTSTTGTEASPAVALMHKVARPITLAPLRPEQTRSLVQSLFGDVEHVVELAERIHHVSEGNPRWAMLVCERLVERGIARYRAGRWTLPAELGADAVPGTLSAELAARIDALPSDARELAQTLALTEPSAFTLPDYVALTDRADSGRAHRALDALVAAGVLVSANDRYQFRQPEFARLLRDALPPQQAQALHDRLARALEGTSDAALRAHHLLFAGHPEEAARVCVAMPRGMTTWAHTTLTRMHDTLARVLEEPNRLGVAARFEAIQRMLYASVFLGRSECFSRHAPALIERLRLDSGYEQAMTASHPGAATQASVPAPVEGRVFAQPEATRSIIGLAQVAKGLAAVAQDLEMLEGFPPLTPWIASSPTAATIALDVETQLAMQRGRPGRALQLSAELVARLRQPDRGGLDVAQAHGARTGQLYLQGLVRAGGGMEVPAELLAQLEQTPGSRALAWRIRMIAAAMACDFDAARSSERRASLIALQDGELWPGTTARAELVSALFADDLPGVQRGVERTERLAARFPGWRPTHAIARAACLRLQGDAGQALEALKPALESTRAGRHIDWTLAIYVQMLLLLDLGRALEAVACGDRAVEQARVCDLPLLPWFFIAHGMALLATSESERAQACIDRTIAEFSVNGVRGLLLGAAHEVRARVAIAQRDVAALHRSLERCAQEFKLDQHSAMNARYERLLREANAGGLPLPASAQFVPASAAPQDDALVRTVYSRIATCIGAAERAGEVLRMLLEASGARSGYLFGLRGGKLNLLSSVDETETPPDLAQALELYLRDELEDQARPAYLPSNSRPTQPLQPWIDTWGREFEPMLLRGTHEDDTVIAGIAALHHEADERPALARPLLQALTEALIAEDIIDPITCVG